MGTLGLRARSEPTLLCASGKTVEVADPVSWFMIRAGWKVVASDGSEVGEVDEVAGDDTEDIFDGLAIATSSFGKPRYVPAEQVAGISQGVVRLSLTREQVVQRRNCTSSRSGTDHVIGSSRSGGFSRNSESATASAVTCDRKNHSASSLGRTPSAARSTS